MNTLPICLNHQASKVHDHIPKTQQVCLIINLLQSLAGDKRLLAKAEQCILRKKEAFMCHQTETREEVKLLALLSSLCDILL